MAEMPIRHFAGFFIDTLVCGFPADRFGLRVMFTYSILWHGAANVILVFQNSADGLNLWCFVAGVGISLEGVTIGRDISELVPEHIRGRVLNCEQGVRFTSVPVAACLVYLPVPNKPFM